MLHSAISELLVERLDHFLVVVRSLLRFIESPYKVLGDLARSGNKWRLHLGLSFRIEHL